MKGYVCREGKSPRINVPFSLEGDPVDRHAFTLTLVDPPTSSFTNIALLVM